MAMKESTCRTVNILYISVTAFSALCICVMMIAFFYIACGVSDKTIFLTDVGCSVYGFGFFVLNMIISGLISFYNKLFCRISFILGIMGLVVYVLWYNCIIVFRPDLYVIIP